MDHQSPGATLPGRRCGLLPLRGEAKSWWIIILEDFPGKTLLKRSCQWIGLRENLQETMVFYR
jgi:hypothetical protein